MMSDMRQLDKKLLWLPIIIACSVNFGIYWAQNNDGVAQYRGCIQYNGAQYDPRSGDGPECEEYGLLTHEEPAWRTGLRGIPDAFILGGILGFILMAANGKREEYIKKHRGNKL